jgi:5'-nucleotidase/UDP-sugar diphosphatase
MSKLTITRRSFLAGVAAFFAGVKAWRPAWAQTTAATRVSFVLVNDFYLMKEEVFPDGRARGGFARLAAVVKAERAQGGHVVVSHGGDTLSPSLMSGFDRGAHIVALTNLVAPDIFAPGNHEFDFGKATFFQRMQEATFGLYAANLRGPDGAPLPGFKDRTIIERDGVRIGLTGLAYQNTPRTSSPEDLRFLPTIETAKTQAAALRQEGADFVVVVMHAERGDSLVLQSARAADLILTGHTHDLFVNFDGQSAIVESGYNGLYVTVADIDIKVTTRNGKRETVWWPQFRIIDTATVTPDPEVAAVVARFDEAFAREMDVAIATTAVELDSRNATVRTREAAIGNLFADAMRSAAGADAALMNGGGIRAGKLYPAGSTITRRDILAELPFNNRVVAVEISGRDLRRALENGLVQLPASGGRFPQVSGIMVEADIKRPPGERITSMKVGGAPLDDNRIYKVVTNDFIARGGDGYTTLRDARRILADEDSPLLANQIMDYVKRLGTVQSRVEGRIVVK